MKKDSCLSDYIKRVNTISALSKFLLMNFWNILNNILLQQQNRQMKS